jgi:hypothetical protein
MLQGGSLGDPVPCTHFMRSSRTRVPLVVALAQARSVHCCARLRFSACGTWILRIGAARLFAHDCTWRVRCSSHVLVRLCLRRHCGRSLFGDLASASSGASLGPSPDITCTTPDSCCVGLTALPAPAGTMRWRWWACCWLTSSSGWLRPPRSSSWDRSSLSGHGHDHPAAAG